MAIQPIAMQAQTANFMLPSEARMNNAQADMAVNKNAMMQQEVQDKSRLDQLYRQTGGDINAMMKSPDIGFENGTRLQALSSENVKANAAAQAAKIDQGLKMLDAGAQIVGGANDQASWDAARNQMGQMFGEQALQGLPEQYDPVAQKRLMDQSLSFKDKLQLQQQELANRREERTADYQNRSLGLMQQRIDASERNAAIRAGGSEGGDGGKWKVDLDRGVRYNDQGDVIPLSGGAVPKPESAAEKSARIKVENENRLADKDFASSVTAANAAKDLFEGATGSGAGKARDAAYAMFGASTEGAQKAAQLKVIAGKLVAGVPKFSGPQSDKDVQLYREMAGQVGDDSIPIETRKAALQTVMDLQQAEAERRKGYSSGSGDSNQSTPATQKTVVRTGTHNGRKVIQYSDGSTSYGD